MLKWKVCEPSPLYDEPWTVDGFGELGCFHDGAPGGVDHVPVMASQPGVSEQRRLELIVSKAKREPRECGESGEGWIWAESGTELEFCCTCF